MLQGDLGPDGAKGDKGEPGMTVSVWFLPRGSVWRRWLQTADLHDIDIVLVFLSVFCSVFPSLFCIQEDEIREYVRSEMNQHCGESFMQLALLIYNSVVPKMNFRW